jgi:hypothetical protein
MKKQLVLQGLKHFMMKPLTSFQLQTKSQELEIIAHNSRWSADANFCHCVNARKDPLAFSSRNSS